MYLHLRCGHQHLLSLALSLVGVPENQPDNIQPLSLEMPLWANPNSSISVKLMMTFAEGFFSVRGQLILELCSDGRLIGSVAPDDLDKF